ncbi:hypothetical protein BDM02DRAFT_3270823 [Thelephora ganbajun]|uniref:Uncharacterized protein n=1 Tax=Thelephora ganbajun TaxID=370292 RepID=A0ACB6ZAJ0_THEGA|nr:hypothetical protein BDM02DRAFT_3270823 [Thelephora ganbajun]
MNRLFGKRSKKSPKPSPKQNFPGTPANAAVELLRPREDLDIVPDDERGNRGEDKRLPSPEVSTSGVAVDGTEDRGDPTRENTTDTREGECRGRPAEASKVPEREYENTALTTTAILSVPKEPAGESSPLGPLKAVLRTIAAVHANHQETVAIGNKIEVLLSCIVALEERFDSRPGDVEEQRRRRELIGYVVIPPSDAVLSSF